MRRLDNDQRAVGLVGQQIQLAVGSLADVADALVQIARQRFAAQLTAVVGKDDALEAPGAVRGQRFGSCR